MQRTFDAAFCTEPDFGDLESPSEVCLGALYDAYALPHDSKQSKDLFRSRLGGCDEFVVLEVRKKDHHHVLQLWNTVDEIAVLDTQSSTRLKAMEEFPSVRFEGVVPQESSKKRGKSTKKKPLPLEISINIYGRKADAEDMGSNLSAESVFLQHPKVLPGEVEYHNPQFLKFSDDEIDMGRFVGITNDSPSMRRGRVSDEISSILDSLVHENFNCTRHGEIPGLSSRLKLHQDKAVQFILEREDHEAYSAASEGLPVVRRTVTDSEKNYGGILADVMGLGKTLSILAAILQSLPDARVFEKFYDISEGSNDMSSRTKATLVVVSSAQLLESWCSEIQDHFEPEALQTVIFHGSRRTKDATALRSADVVLTTYATVAAERKGANSLQQMYWFRIVLDEAHWIRNSISKQFRAVSQLAARNRWCLTGTPIQNKLDDLASLAAFLRLPQFTTKASFQKAVLDPLYQGGPEFSTLLRSWLRTYCMRRTEKLLQIPNSREEIVPLVFSDAERQRYDSFLHQTKREIDDVVSQNKSIKKYNILITAILRMRMLCNTGTLQRLSSSERPFNRGMPKDTACERCAPSIEEDEGLLLTAFRFCPDCGRSLQVSSPFPGLSNDYGLEEDSTPQFCLSSTPDTLSSPLKGYSEKLNSVMRNVQASEPGSKHIVFSYWTSTLDYLSQFFENAGLNHVQVDGRTSFAERSRRLQQFREDADVLALVMSIETGALGLNLTAANRVHIVEPQWNPSVEEQAISRALRMGQKREVTIFRYSMKGTIEQNIISLQKKKRAQAKFLFDSDSAGELDGKLEDLKFVLDLPPIKGPLG